MARYSRIPYHLVSINGEQIEVCSFEYLGSILESTSSVDREVESILYKDNGNCLSDVETQSI